MLASVSKDRQMSLYFTWEFILQNPDKFANIDTTTCIEDFLQLNTKLIDRDNLRSKSDYFIPIVTKQVHSRVIYSVSVSSSGEFIATVSRDKCLKVFRVFGTEGVVLEEILKLKLKKPIHAVEFFT